MKWSTVVAVLVVIAVTVIWAIIFRVSDKHPALMPSLAGCYLPTGGDDRLKVYITTSGAFRYGDKLTSVVPYEDKQSLSLLPELKIVVSSTGELLFEEGNPLLLRIDRDNRGFIVPSESGDPLAFRKSQC